MMIESVTLEGVGVRLVPMSHQYGDALVEIGLEEDIWRHGLTHIKTQDDMRRYIDEALELQRRGSAVPFVTIEKGTGRVAGSTRFMNIDTANRKVEIGSTWLGKHWQRTGLNTEAKFLMMQHAFEVWKCVRVELKTDVLNERSRTAIRRLGATEEGVLRKHAITSQGRVRDTVYYSIIDDEWEEIKDHFKTHLLRT